MVRAILDGTKTQTRRVVKPQPYEPLCGNEFPAVCKSDFWAEEHVGKWIWPTEESEFFGFSPYGQPGEKLWVRETFCDDWKDTRGIVYRADGGIDGEMADAGCNWRPSIFMPRAASRITLEVTGVRLERLQDISVADAIAEGVPRGGPENPDGIEQREYRALWEQINGLGSWDANPWVWVIEFRKLG